MIPAPESLDVLFEELCGEEFGKGTHRNAHHVKGLPHLVMKVSKNGNFANWCEYLVDRALQERSEPVAALVGSVKAISATGKYLIMERLNDVDRSLSGIQYPSWLNDGFKHSAYGLTAAGNVKIREYGTLKFAGLLATHHPQFDEAPPPRIVPSGHDVDYVALEGEQIAVGAGRTVHKVKGHPNHVMKVCAKSHKPNMAELLVYSSLWEMNADEYRSFGVLECSRSGKYLVMEALPDLPADFSGSRPDFPSWLIEHTDACLGVTLDRKAKIRSYSEICLGDVLAQAPLRVYP